MFGVCAGQDKPQVLVEDAQVTLAVEIPAAGRGRIDQTGKTGYPGSLFADASGHLHLVDIVWLILGIGQGSDEIG